MTYNASVYGHSYCSSFAQPEGISPPKAEEEGQCKYEVKEKQAGGNELLSRVQELEDELKTSEEKRIDLIHGKTALLNKLKASREEEDHVHQEMANVKERLLPILTSQVRRIVGLGTRL